MKEALFYSKLSGGMVRCELCPHHCKISDQEVGICGVRQNSGGSLFSLVYGKAIAVHVDPIEKKPLFHVFPGSRSFSIATVGCNFRCRFCQNADISQYPKENGRVIGETLSAEQVVEQALASKCKTIAYTYTEPTVFFEYAYDCAKLAHGHELKNVFVTNGYICAEPLRYLHPYLHAANVDLKSFDAQFYKKIVGGGLQEVLDSLLLMKRLGIWIEITTLLIPTYVDSDEQLKNIAQFIAEELGPGTPWHVSRFYPHYQITNVPPTAIETLRRARRIGLDSGLRYVYSGNVPGDEGENTYCYNCGATIIERHGYHIDRYRITAGQCDKCGASIDGLSM